MKGFAEKQTDTHSQHAMHLLENFETEVNKS